MVKKNYIQIRVNESDSELVQRLAQDYGVSVSDLVRFSLHYIDSVRPAFTVSYSIVSKRGGKK